MSGVGRKQHDSALLPFALQKADGTCNTNFKKTQALEQVTKVLEDFVNRDRGILVSGTPMCQSVLALGWVWLTLAGFDHSLQLACGLAEASLSSGLASVLAGDLASVAASVFGIRELRE